MGQRTKPRESVAFAAQPPDQQDTKNKAATQAMVTNTDFNHRIRGLATVARQTVAASIGAATAATQNQVRLSRLHPTEDLQRPQPPHRLYIIQDMDAAGRCCSRETAADFPPTDEMLNLHRCRWPLPASHRQLRNTDQTPNPSLQRWVSVTGLPEARGKRKDPPLGFFAAPARPTPSRGRQGHDKTRQRRQMTTRRPRRRHKSRRCNEPMGRKRVKRSTGCSDAIGESSSDESVFQGRPHISKLHLATHLTSTSMCAQQVL